MNAYKFCVDDVMFCLGRKSIESLGENCFTQMIDEKINHITEKIVFNPQNRTFFMDMDIDSFKFIVSLLRGYDVDAEYNLKKKVERDLKLLNIDYEFSDKLIGKSRVLLGDDLEKIEQYVNEIESKINDSQSFDMMNAISTDQNIMQYLKNKNNDNESSSDDESESNNSFLNSSEEYQDIDIIKPSLNNSDENVNKSDEKSDDKNNENVNKYIKIDNVQQPNLSEYLSNIPNTSKTSARYARLG